MQILRSCAATLCVAAYVIPFGATLVAADQGLPTAKAFLSVSLRSQATVTAERIEIKNLGWPRGETYQALLRVTLNGRPVSGQVVEVWLTGERGTRTGSVSLVTDRTGRVTARGGLPTGPSWNRVYLHAACKSVGAYNSWQIKPQKRPRPF